MTRILHYLVILLGLLMAASIVGLNFDQTWPMVFGFGLLVGAYSHALDDGIPLPRLIWQSPRLYRNAGLFLKMGDRRWWLVSVNSR
jgi:hypothetical protein